MTWTEEGFKANVFAKKAKKVESVRTKNPILIAKKLNYTDLKGVPGKDGIEMARFSIENLIKEGWLKELPDRYVMTEKAKKRIQYLKEISERGELD